MEKSKAYMINRLALFLLVNSIGCGNLILGCLTWLGIRMQSSKGLQSKKICLTPPSDGLWLLLKVTWWESASPWVSGRHLCQARQNQYNRGWLLFVTVGSVLATDIIFGQRKTNLSTMQSLMEQFQS